MNESPCPLTTPVTQLAGVAEKTAQRLQKIGIHSLFDLLLHLPIRYEDKTCSTALADVTPNREYLIIGRILQYQERHTGRKKRLRILLEDDSGEQCQVTLFHYRASQKTALQEASHMQCYGKIEACRFGLSLSHPQYRLFSQTVKIALETTLTPVYTLSQGLQQQRIRNLVKYAFAYIHKHPFIDLIPVAIREKQALLPLHKALQISHTPDTVSRDKGLLHTSRHSIAFEELLAYQLGLRHIRQQTKTTQAPSFPRQCLLADTLVDSLDFALTSAQQRVIEEIKQDICLPDRGPMLRLIQGDVGCGKTIVAAIAALHCLEQGWQCAIMAPTELLAMQHFHNFQQWLEPLGLTVISLTSKTRQKKQYLSQIKAGQGHIVIGTQALIQEQVQFNQLGLCIIDEQHRFGVHQRLLLKNKGQQKTPHQLIMTATPIPRSLAMTFYADLDLSVIDELPASRLPVETVALPDSKRTHIMQRLHALFQKNQQAYWVCPLIEDSDNTESSHLRSTQQTLDTLQKQLPHANVALVHGKMPPQEKLEIMQAFKQGQYQLLVSTTVIEVGIDVPNATLIVIENADRLGLAQLHQLRGRVGRGHKKSYCVLMYGHTLGNKGKERLTLLRNSNNGFEIAQKDLKMRGPGEFLGLKQSGSLNFRVADPETDQHMLPKVQETADKLLRDYPDQAQALMNRWLKQSLHYTNV